MEKLATRCKARYVVGPRPTETPNGEPISPEAVLYNAPRPLYGLEWQGDFIHGIFYSVIEPTDEHFDLFDARNASLDAYALVHVTREEVWAWAVEHYKAEGLDLNDKEQYDPDDPYIWGMVWGAFLDSH